MAQIALAQQALTHWVEAEAALLETLAHADDPWVARQRVYLEGSLSTVRAHLGSLAVESNLAGAELRIDGRLVGRLPLAGPIRLVAGETVLELRAPGVAPVTRRLTVDPGGQTVQSFTFLPTPSAPALTVSSPRPAPAPRQGEVAGRAGWILAGSAGALLLLGVGGVVTREWEANIYDDDVRCAPLPGRTRVDRCGTNRDIGNVGEGVAIAAFASAGITAAVSAWLLLGRSRRDRPFAASYVDCRWAGAWLGCSGAFP